LLNKYYTSINRKFKHIDLSEVKERFKNIDWYEVKDELIAFTILLVILAQLVFGLFGLISYYVPVNGDLGDTFIQFCRIVQYTWIIWIFIYIYIEWQDYKDHLRRIAENL